MITTTGRDRARKEPFWATSLSRMLTGPRAITQGLHALIQRSPALAPYMWIGSGWRTGSSEHKSGRAIDIMITADTGRTPTDAERAAGNALVGWLIANAKALGVQGIIFSRDSKRRPQLWGYSHPGTWVDGAPRGSISGDHVDHVHVYFTSLATWPASLGGASIGAAAAKPVPKPKPPAATAADRLKAYPVNRRTVTLSALIAQARAKKRVWTEPVETVQECLRRGGFSPGVIDGYWGPKTTAAYAGFQRSLGYRGKDADGIPGRASLAKLGGRYGFKAR